MFQIGDKVVHPMHGAVEETPFYAEMGGQVADHGVISCGDARFEVTDVQKNKGGI